MPKNKKKNKTIYALLSVNTSEGEEVAAFGPFANEANATDWATFGRGAFPFHTFRGCGSLEECQAFVRQWNKETEEFFYDWEKE